MPTRMRALRVPDERWQAAASRAASEDTNLSAVINDLLDQYAARTVSPQPAA